MITVAKTKKITAFMLVSAMMSTSVLPVSNSFAHDRHNPHVHNGNGQNWGHRQHRNFHDRFGRGIRGEEAFLQHRQQQKRANERRRNKKDKRRDLIAAGILGLAVGAIIAGSSRPASQPRTTYTYPEPQYREPTRYQYVEPAPRNNEPEVIRYEDTVSYEPWTQGWRSWCENKYRSFNPARGTFRGYDGHDHFCVVK